MNRKILFIGPLFCETDTTKAGGTDVLFDQLLQDLRSYDVAYEVIDSNTDNFSSNAAAFLSIMKGFFSKIRAYDHISLHGNTNHFMLIAPWIILYAKLLGKGTSLRKFAGMMHKEYETADPIRKVLARFSLKHVDVVFFETQYLVRYFKRFNPNTYWFPNVRHRPEGGFQPPEYARRFLFIGSITKEKGIDELIEAAKRIGDSYTIDLYGKIDERYYTEEKLSRSNLHYRGFLDPKEVIATIQRYDALVLPSYREGYPGVIIEAFMAGRAVLATRLSSIQEMVEEGKNGILIEPRSVDALVAGFEAFDESRARDMAYAAYEAADLYDSKRASLDFLEKIGFRHVGG